MTTYPNLTEAQAKHKSYQVADELADLLGRPHGHHLTMPAGWLVDVTIDGEETDAILLRTNNAGFRGIEGTFELADGTHRILSLGYITCTAA